MHSARVELRDCLVGGDEGVGFLVWLKIGNQEFPIGNAYESKEKDEAEWYARMLREALDRAYTPSETKREPGEFYGKDCPQGMVQVEFVGVDPKLRYSDYGWKPSPHAFLEVYVDGQRFSMHVGDMSQFGHEGKRGLHINYPIPAAVENRSINALTITLEKKDG
jgi:hypothetical protein